MGEKPQNIKHRHISLGVLAHVDAGKTTLSEGLLFKCGRIRKIGRVDHKDAYLDTYELERERGITIFSKQAVFSMGDMEVTLLIHRGMWIFLLRWSVPCRCWIMRSW